MPSNCKFIVGSVVGAIFLGVLMHHVVYNPTKSVTRGYYFIYPSIQYNVNDLVLICLQDKKQAVIMHALKLPYISGECRYEMPYLLKQIVAKSQDIIEITPRGVLINGELRLNSVALREYNHAQFSSLDKRKFVLGNDEFFVLGQTTHSYDSRYFGIIKGGQIYEKALLLLAADKPIW